MSELRAAIMQPVALQPAVTDWLGNAFEALIRLEDESAAFNGVKTQIDGGISGDCRPYRLG